MTEIVNGELVLNELSKNSKGGTELMAMRMVRDIDPDLLKQFHIIHSRVREIDPDQNNILVLHDLPNDPESAVLADPEYRKQFKKLVFVSNWQLQYYSLVHNIPYSECEVLFNAIEPIEDCEKDYSGTIKLIYHTTPHRGLELLVPVFEQVEKACEQHGINVELDVYSSFSIYGWKQRDEQYKELFNRCKRHPKINYYGAVENEEVRKALEKSHIFAYPSIWPETSCLAAIEALSAKNLVVCPNYAALPETCMGFAQMYQFDEDKNRHANKFAQILFSTILGLKNSDVQRGVMMQKAYTDVRYDWKSRKQQWETLLRSLL